ncbi:hypothetical protein NQ314_012198 [Rhamnusium bicolor]|uniref:C2H2-type domain-containing protein n=1 Tax=Rhamnusium bicolor TaxID=1586634 RepID=A0AAV8XDZ3_9CUCU|nr:hypothetical protein NQ314_012198 [Rhamnusium bicolor]
MVQETIILQIENPEEKKYSIPDSDLIFELQKFLCKSRGSSITSNYNCDICDESYGCINCLKSHYETLHITNTVTQYKCKFSTHLSKSLVCPVCDLTFNNRSDTMDHYITHSVACEICGSGFDRQMHLTDHYKTSHNKGDYQATYECELCKSIYQYPVSLTKHYQTFHKMILCQVCKFRFGSVKELQDHEKNSPTKIKCFALCMQ